MLNVFKLLSGLIDSCSTIYTTRFLISTKLNVECFHKPLMKCDQGHYFMGTTATCRQQTNYFVNMMIDFCMIV